MEKKITIIQLIATIVGGFASAIIAIFGLKREMKTPKPTTETTEPVKETPVEQPKNDKFLK